MKQKAIAILALLGIAAIFMAACQKSTEPTPSSGINDNDKIVWPGPRPDAEAEMAALWLSGELFAPDALYNKVHIALASLRRQWSAAVPEVAEIRFFHMLESKEIMVSLDSATLALYRAGKFTGYDSLNQIYAGANSDSIIEVDDGFFLAIAMAKFKTRFDLDSLSRVYAQLPGVLYAHPNRVARFFEQSNLLPFLDNQGQISFLLIADNWETCQPQQPLMSCFHCWYFRAQADQFELVGDFMLTWENLWAGPFPDWWDEVAPVYCRVPAEKMEILCNEVK
ncbi:MAG: hypothetical protein WBP29_03810 [Candidatus Zixiibacteriota bacterium]